MAKKPPTFSLTEVLRTCPQNDPKKISLILQEIASIDESIPNQICAPVQVVFLSRNLLTNVMHIEQFINLVTLSLSDNYIRYKDNLQALSHLKKLERLSLLGNAVIQLPFYHEHVLSLCPLLISLDQCPVDASQHTEARINMFKIKSCEEIMQTNELRNTVLRHLSLLSGCHEEMNKMVFGPYTHMLGLHISSSAEGKEPAFVLRQLMLGKVFKKLQQCHRELNYCVQVGSYSFV